METESRIYVAGASGMLGGAVVRKLRERGYEDVITEPPDRKPLDLSRG